jgi:hypothetical protein
VLAQGLADPVAGAGRTGLDRLVLQVALDVAGEGGGGVVAARAVLLERAHDDPVEVAPHLAAQARGLGAPPLGQVVEGLRGLGQARAGAGRLLLADETQAFAQRRGAQPRTERCRAGEQLVEQHAQRVHVRPRVDVERAQLRLLGAHVLERADDRAHRGVHRPLGEPLVQRLGHAEVDDLRHGLRVLHGDHHVGRLDVAVDDPLLVRVLDGVADGQEERQAVAHGQAHLVAIPGDGQPLDQLHHEVRQARLGGAGVEDARDVRVVHESERLALGLEAPQDFLRVHARLDELQRHAAADGLGLLRDPDGAHATLAEPLQEPIGSDASVRRLRFDDGSGRRLRGFAAGGKLAGHERFEFSAPVCASLGRLRS